METTELEKRMGAGERCRTVRGWVRVARAAPLAAALACGGGPGAEVGEAVQAEASAPRAGARTVVSENAAGTSITIQVAGGPVVDPASPFFQALGSNGRSCASCHVAASAMTVTPAELQRRFERTRGTDPVFRTNDGATSPEADVSTLEARRIAYALLLERGLIRVGLPVPPGAEFELASVDDPYGHASAQDLSLFRRPLPAANLRFLSTVMWDGRETFKDPGQASGFATIPFDLADQANGATLGHAQAAEPLTPAQRDAIVAFELGLFTAQARDGRAGPLDRDGADGGPWALARQEFHFGINDVLGGDPAGTPFSPVVMTLFAAWAGASEGERSAARAALARGEALFNQRTFDITGVGGLNDDLGVKVLRGTCTTCHDAPNAGDHSVPMPLRLGVADASPVGGLDVSRLPLYTLRNKATGETVRTTDPGRALVTGRWKDVGRFKGPVLRALAARPPYFHNGSAATLADVVRFYDERFGVGLTPGEQADLAAFLAAL